MTKEENLRGKHRRWAIRIERRGIERRFRGYKEERKWTEEKENNVQMLRSLKLMECTPAGWSTTAAHGLKNYTKKINYKLSLTPYNQGDCLCLYHHQESQNKHLSNVQCTPNVLAYSLQRT